MRVRMTNPPSGSVDTGAGVVDWPSAGEEIDLPDDAARDLCDRGQAVPVRTDTKAETATAPKAEKRTARKSG